MGLGKLLGLEEDPKINALVDSNHKLTKIIEGIFSGYQTNLNSLIEEYKRLNKENEEIKKILKEKFKDE